MVLISKYQGLVLFSSKLDDVWNHEDAVFLNKIKVLYVRKYFIF